MNFTDTHSHINAAQFIDDIDEVILRAREQNVNNIIIPSTISTDYSSMEKIANRYNFIYLAYGLHPTEINNTINIDREIEILKEKIAEGRLVAIGETGLDKYWSTDFLKEQIESLHKHIELAIDHNLPLILHCRDAFGEMFDVLEQYKGKVRGVFHGFSGTTKEVERVEKLGGFYYGIGGVVTFKNSGLIESVKAMPLNKIVLETDAPYLTPTPHRGKRNEPSYIPLIANHIANALSITIDELSQKCEESTQNLFNLR